jgi:CRP-like cAMP-binding protein
MIGPEASKVVVSDNKMRKETMAKLTHTPINFLCVGQIFGIEDVVRSRNYTITVKCLTNNAQLYCITATEFLKNINRDEKTATLFRELVYHRDLSTFTKIKGAIEIKRTMVNGLRQEQIINE